MKTLALDWSVFSTAASGIEVLPHGGDDLCGDAPGASSAVRGEYDGQLVGRPGENVQPLSYMNEISYCPADSPPWADDLKSKQQVGCAAQQSSARMVRFGSFARITAPQHCCLLYPR